MRIYIANTDHDWYTFLSERPDLDEVNFWMPSDRRRFKAIDPGELFVFKLKARFQHAIVGFGVFERGVVLPAWLAWDAFDQANGAPDFTTMNRRIAHYRRAAFDALGQYEIGCLLVSQPVWFDAADWVIPPADWAMNIVQGKTYDTQTGEGQRIYRECLERAPVQNRVLLAGAHSANEEEASVTGSGAAGVAADGEALEQVSASDARFGKPVLVQPRLGQGGFRIAVTEAYRRTCAVTTEHSLPVLEAAHIKPYADSGGHRVANGLLLRADIHRLFDRGYVTVTPDHRFVVSRRLKEEYDNGKVYYEYHGRRIIVPADALEQPSRQLLEWHNERVFAA